MGAFVALVSWWPLRPRQHVHTDYANRYGHNFQVSVDRRMKGQGVFEMHLTTYQRTVDVFRNLFAADGLPKKIISDKGPIFSSYDFIVFFQSKTIQRILASLYIPASTEAAGRSVGLLKQVILKDVLAAKYLVRACAYR